MGPIYVFHVLAKGPTLHVMGSPYKKEGAMHPPFLLHGAAHARQSCSEVLNTIALFNFNQRKVLLDSALLSLSVRYTVNFFSHFRFSVTSH